jgi:hypothetical protein
MNYLFFQSKLHFSSQVKRLMLWFLSLIPVGRFLETYFEALRRKLKVFPTYSLREMETGGAYLDFQSSEYRSKRADIGLVMQGPIRHENDFTYYAVKRYLSHFPGMQVFLSTWDGEDLSKFNDLINNFSNFHVILNVKPAHPGTQNINYQIVSTCAGLNSIADKGLDYAIKTRTDQCFFDPYALDKLRSIFQLNGNQNTESRIVFLSQNSFLLRLYGPSDMFQFGETSQLQKYWDVPLEFRNTPVATERNSIISMREYCREEICEVYVCANYLRKIGIDLNFTLQQNFEIFRDLFIVVDSNTIDMVWDKYSYSTARWNNLKYSALNQEWTHSFWQALSDMPIDYSKLEALIDKKLN